MPFRPGTIKILSVALAAAGVVALPFVFHRPQESGDWTPGGLELVVITPHNEAIRHEFARGFSAWHRQRYGQPVYIDWRVIGGTTEIMRYLGSEYAAAAEHYVKRQLRAGKTATLDDAMGMDDPGSVSCRIDVFFGGGTYDHERAERQRLTVPAWSDRPPAGLFADAAGRELIPEQLSGEVWRGKCFYGNVLSTFGICYNLDRLRDQNITAPPGSWRDLTDPRYFGLVGVADPTKSGSVAKAFEMIVHEACARSVAAAGYGSREIEAFERRIAENAGDSGELAAYQNAIESGWLDGIRLVRRIGANARYFTDSAGKVPVDVGAGVTAAGIAIDFYGRLQSELAHHDPKTGRPVMNYVTPVGGSSVSADPISLLRGAPHRELAVRFIEYVLGEDGQRLWNYRVGEPGGPDRYALRRLPIRRTFYPAPDDPELDRGFESHRPHLTDPLGDPACDVYRIASAFTYRARWTSRHFGIQRDLIRAMCMDSGDELRECWAAIIANGGPERQPEAMRLMESLPDTPVPLDWRSAVEVYSKMPRTERLRRWTGFFRQRYRQAKEAVDLGREK
ncbi:MAG: ABC transporter substrate-binding protein [Kiritimatiellae bacterium]|nr:ABC transporter substrate-binding protein [Kiritimatiellia bacterium]